MLPIWLVYLHIANCSCFYMNEYVVARTSDYTTICKVDSSMAVHRILGKLLEQSQSFSMSCPLLIYKVNMITPLMSIEKKNQH